MLGFIRNFLDDNAREVKKLARVVEEINALEAAMLPLADDDLRAKTAQFRDRLDRGEDLDRLLPEAFAVVREASRRTLGLRPFDVQLVGGLVLHSGRIAEMQTGEGKTLAAVCPAYLNALPGHGVHVVTVNDYLAKRDAEWMGRIYRFLGLEVGVIVHGLDWHQRRAAYHADITYGTNNEFGFDYLRDNMAVHPGQLVQRELNYAIVDEVDSILIDEARTPLIISGPSDKANDLYYTFARLIPRLKPSDYTVDEKMHTASLNEEGVAKMEKWLGVENLYDDRNMELTHHLQQALKAHTLMKRDRDYVVKDGEVIIVDEFTGRLMFGRRYSDGLHQAIEAKEGVRIEQESQTLATITFQNYFRMYAKLAGMTGTAETEEEEFRKIYKLSVVAIPTNLPMIRKELPDKVYKTESAKFRAVVEEIARRHEMGQPVLVGTISIEKSEILSALLRKRGIPHQVLNAKYHEKEAEIIAQAGRLGAVTIATNMAGRGVDILLGGNPEFLAQAAARGRLAAGEEVTPEVFRALVGEYQAKTTAERTRVVELGGLHVLGTERHESRRIDNQLRGRCGRQGDPGSSTFYCSLEDDLMRLFGSDNIAALMDRLGVEEDVPIEHALVTRSIEAAQKRVESRNFETRKHVLEYDDIMNQQRELIYSQRRRVLLGEDMKEHIREMIEGTVQRAVRAYAPEGVHREEWDLAALLEHAGHLFLPDHALTVRDLAGLNREELALELLSRALEFYEGRERELGTEVLREIERLVLLRVVDQKWMDHIDAMQQLREGIGLRAYGQKDPLVEYRFEGYEMFQNMIEAIQEDVVRYIFRVNVVQPPTPRQAVENQGGQESRAPAAKGDKVGRNDPCPCGSGKKYKKCCGRAAS